MSGGVLALVQPRFHLEWNGRKEGRKEGRKNIKDGRKEGWKEGIEGRNRRKE